MKMIRTMEAYTIEKYLRELCALEARVGDLIDAASNDGDLETRTREDIVYGLVKAKSEIADTVGILLGTE